jgi:hypothetical protein
MIHDRIPLTLLPHELRSLTGATPPGYRATYTAALDGRIPAERGLNGRWTVARADLPAIAAALGCAPAQSPEALAA